MAYGRKMTMRETELNVERVEYDKTKKKEKGIHG